MTEPVIYRRRSELVEAVRITAANVVDVAELAGGRVTWIKPGLPHLYLPGSVQPARVGDWAVHLLTSDQPWYPMRGHAFGDAYEPACPVCTAGPVG